jgi:hypothetical protein
VASNKETFVAEPVRRTVAEILCETEQAFAEAAQVHDRAAAVDQRVLPSRARSPPALATARVTRAQGRG